MDMYILSCHLLNTHINTCDLGLTDLLRSNDQFTDLPVGYVMLVVVFLGLLAVALSYPESSISQLFDLMDVNKDGVVRIRDWFTGYNNVDLNGDELLTIEELAAELHPGSSPLVFKDMFTFLDKLDGKEDGLIYPSSAPALFHRMGGKNDGKVTREEFEATFLLLLDDGSKQLLA